MLAARTVITTVTGRRKLNFGKREPTDIASPQSSHGTESDVWECGMVSSFLQGVVFEKEEDEERRGEEGR